MSLSRGKIISYIFLIFFLISPLIYIPGIFNSYEYPKFVLFILFSFIVSLWFFINCIIKKESIKLDKLTILVLIYLAVVFLADIFGLDPKISLIGSVHRYQGFVTLLSGVLLFLVSRNTRTPSRCLSFSPGRWVSISVFLISSFAIYQWISLYIFHQLSIPAYHGRIVGTFGNPNFLGGYLAMLLPFILFSNNPLKGRLYSIGALIIALLSILAIYFTGSRSAMIAVIFVILIFLIRFFLKIVKFKKIVLICLLFVLLIFLKPGLIEQSRTFLIKHNCDLIANSEVISKLFNQIKNAENYKIDECLNVFRISMWDNQLVIWQGGVEAFFNKPLLGYGQENFELAFKKVRFFNVDNGHNIFIETAVSSGALGLILFTAIIIFAFKKLKLVYKLSLAVFLIGGFFNPLSISQIAFFWFLISLASKED